MEIKNSIKNDLVAAKSQVNVKVGRRRGVSKYLNDAFNKLKAYFEKPNDETIEVILRQLAISKSDGEYEWFRGELQAMIGRRVRERVFLEFFKRLSNKLAKKMREELVKREREVNERADERYRELICRYELELSRSRKEILAEIIPKVLKIINDQAMCSILKALSEGDKRVEELKRSLGLDDNDLTWRINVLMDLSLISPSNGGMVDEYSISNVGREVVRGMGCLEERIYTIDYIKRLIAIKAVGDKCGSEKLLAIVSSGRMRGHENHILKMMENVNDYVRRLSQAIFEGREMGERHAKHLLPPGIQIIDHGELGKLLVLEYWLRDLIDLGRVNMMLKGDSIRTIKVQQKSVYMNKFSVKAK